MFLMAAGGAKDPLAAFPWSTPAGGPWGHGGGWVVPDARSPGVTRAWLGILLLASAFAGCLHPAAPEAAAPRHLEPTSVLPASLAYEGGACRGFVATTPGDAAFVRPLVPPDLALAGEASGRAVILVTLWRCGHVEAARENGSAAFARVGVLLEPQAPGAGLEAYVLWSLTDARFLADAWASRGFANGLVPRISLAEEETLLLARVVRADVPWTASPYAVELRAAAPTDAARGDAILWWHDGPQGRIGVFESPTVAAASPAQGEARAPAGSLPALVMGTTRAPLVGAWLGGDVRASVRSG